MNKLIEPKEWATTLITTYLDKGKQKQITIVPRDEKSISLKTL